MRFLMISVKNVFSCMRSLYPLCPWPPHWLQICYITDSNVSSWTRALTRSTPSTVWELIWWVKWYSSETFLLPLWTLSTHWYTFLCIIQFSPYCANISLRISEGFTPSKTKWQYDAQQWCNSKAESTCLHYKCMSFTECNGYHIICLHLTQYVVCEMCAHVLSDKLPGFYMQIALALLILFVHCLITYLHYLLRIPKGLHWR
jgi:hypothetical protein